MLLATALVLELARESLTGTHCRYREYVNGLPTDTYVTRPCPADVPPLALRGEVQGEGLRFVDGRVIRRELVDHWQHDYDAATGELVQRIPLFYRAKPARVFIPNPVAKLNDPDLQDLNDQSAHIPDAAYTDVQLDDAALHGPWANLVDRQAPSVAPPEGNLVFNRTDDGFEDVNAWYHIHRTQDFLQAVGFKGSRAIAPYAIEVDAHAANGEDHSFFIPSSTQPGRGALFFGEGGTDDAEDADLVVHEYAHALHEWIAPATFAGSFGSEARAFSEAFADYLAFSAHYDARRESGRDPFCFADWDARCWLDATSERCGYEPGTDCLRRLDSTLTMADYLRNDSSGVEHRNGAIFSSALREIRTATVGRTFDIVLIESLYGAPPRPTFAAMAERLLHADRLITGGEHVSRICSAFVSRGILTECDVLPRGELTLFRSTQRGIAIPDNDPAGITATLRIDDPRAIESISVRVDATHPANGDLRVELVAPDGTTVLLQAVSTSLGADLHVTYGRTATPAQPLDVLRGRSAAGTWTLRVSDQHPRDTGTLLSWGLDIQFAGDEPVAERPREGRAQMIPVVTRLRGGGGEWKSDVQLANPHATPRTATLIFTRSGENGLERFGAVQVALAAGQTTTLEDVVDRVFHTARSGSLEVLGDVVVMSRTYTTNGQEIPPNLETTALGEPSLFVAPLTEPPQSGQYYIGITETAGGRGVVRFGTRSVTIEPFSHVHLGAGNGLLEVHVQSGDARVSAYISQLARGDAMFIPAQRPRTGIAPAITGQTSEPPEWRSDLWIATKTPMRVCVDAIEGGSVDADAPAIYEDVLARLFHRTVTFAGLRVHVPNEAFAATRIVHGDTMQFVPLLTAGPAEQHVLLIGEGRVNVGIVAEHGAGAEVLVYDAAGVETARHILSTNGGFVQRAVVGTRAVVRFLAGTSGRAYASVIDARTGDAAFVPGQ